LLLYCWCVAVGPALNFTVYYVLLRSGVVLLVLLSQVDHLRAPNMVASGTARLDVVLLKPIPCHCCSYRSPREWWRALLYLRSLLLESASRLLWRRAILRGWTLCCYDQFHAIVADIIRCHCNRQVDCYSFQPSLVISKMIDLCDKNKRTTAGPGR
jgi:hypothetical protein